MSFDNLGLKWINFRFTPLDSLFMPEICIISVLYLLVFSIFMYVYLYYLFACCYYRYCCWLTAYVQICTESIYPLPLDLKNNGCITFFLLFFIFRFVTCYILLALLLMIFTRIFTQMMKCVHLIKMLSLFACDLVLLKIYCNM